MTTLSERDRLDITELGSKYAWAIDRHQYELFDEVFTPDAVITYPRGVEIRGLDQYIRYVKAFHAMHDGTQHLIANHRATPVDDYVEAHSYAILTIMMHGVPGGEIFRGGACYTDRVVGTKAGWRIAERHAESMWRGDNVNIIELSHVAVQDLL